MNAKHALITVGLTLACMVVIFAIADFLNVTAWVLYPASVITGNNASLTSSIGNNPSLGFTAGNTGAQTSPGASS